MQPQPECHVPVRLAGKVELVRVLELAPVAIGRREPGEDPLAARDRHAADIRVLPGVSFGRRQQRAVVAQQLLDACLDQRGSP